MDNQNNLGRQYTSNPKFGTIYPNTQYKGYTEEEGTPYGGPSNMQQQKNQILSNVKYHGADQYSQQRIKNQYQGMNQQSENTLNATTPKLHNTLENEIK
ncbi:hypothetical protein BBF96_12510 [Anoxybacter fermentans]|uniref:Uncharacterized protein n=1 Tax=Anoxybacter fermentans TaxID=1323375 RepID=A0A3Q9HRK5_9FIRM|nr:hypothetical protein [Anoxybacter fermentans]AZR74147.1 hypothetical protein BBF96_12510 [Anoxybacter fermentans]